MMYNALRVEVYSSQPKWTPSNFASAFRSREIGDPKIVKSVLMEQNESWCKSKNRAKTRAKNAKKGHVGNDEEGFGNEQDEIE